MPRITPAPVLGAARVQPGAVLGRPAFGLSSGFDPRSIPGLALWLDARFPAGFGGGLPADGSAVASWVDLSGNGRDATQGTAGKRPLFKLGEINGLPGIKFNGSNNSLSTPNVAFASASGVSVYLVIGPDVAPAVEYRCALSHRLSGKADAIVYLMTDQVRTEAWSSNAVNWVGDNSGAAAPATGQTYVYSSVHYGPSGCQVELRQNGVSNGPAASASAWNADTQSPTPIAIGAGGESREQYPLAGRIAAVLWYAGAHGAATRQRIERWLGRLWGVTVA